MKLRQPCPKCGTDDVTIDKNGDIDCETCLWEAKLNLKELEGNG